MGCSLLDNFNIPATLLTLGEGAFVNCTALTSIDVDPAHPNFSSVDGILFNQSKTNLISYPLGKSATYYEVPSTVTRVDTGAFAGNSLLQSIGLPLGLISIGEGAFSNCSALQSIDLPESLEIIESHAYLSCTALASVTLPSSIREIGEMAFLFCDSMTSITVNAAVPPTLGASVFMPILAEEVIYVPSASLAAYQADADWSVYSAIIQSQP